MKCFTALFTYLKGRVTGGRGVIEVEARENLFFGLLPTWLQQPGQSQVEPRSSGLRWGQQDLKHLSHIQMLSQAH